MDDIASIEIGTGLLVVWVASLFVLWKLIDRQGRPGPIKNTILKESVMLVHLGLLVTGGAFLIKGLNLFG